jgi:hypothetical protein
MVADSPSTDLRKSPPPGIAAWDAVLVYAHSMCVVRGATIRFPHVASSCCQEIISPRFNCAFEPWQMPRRYP